MHNKKGYILFLLFSILSVCTVIITLFFARNIAYQNLMQLLTTNEKSSQLALSSVALGQTILYVEPKDEPKQTEEAKGKEDSENYDNILLNNIFPYIHQTQTYKLSQSVEGIDATIQMNMISDNGKINLNTLYDFAEKKFVNEGKEGDRKKFCQWLFEKISKLTKKPSLFNAFEKYLKEKSADFNDVTELLYIKEFHDVFAHTIFYDPKKAKSNTVFLTDIFTIYTEQDTINPWLFSYSWRILLDLPEEISLSKDDAKKVVTTLKKQINWEKEWNTSMKLLYQKEYKDLPQEIKSMLTTEFEANIFSLLLKAIIGETTSTIFTILKANKQNKPVTFDIVKTYQL